MIKRIVLLSVILAFLGTGSFAIDISGGTFSSTAYPLVSYSLLSADLDLSGPVQSYGFTFNANLSNRDYGLESVAVRYIEYDDGTLGVRYAPIEAMSFGYGLLLNDLNTSYSQPAFYRNGQAGLRVNYDGDYFTLEGMGTYSHLYGIQIKDISIFGSNIGFEYLSDSDRASSECFGRSAFGAFMDYPLTDQVKLFVETAGSSNGGEGDMAGVAFDYDLIMAFASIKMGSVSFNDRFIPGYFTAGYDIDPVDFVSLEADGKRRYGTLASVDIGILGAVALNLTNENYNDGGAATSGAILVTPLPYLSISGYVKELSFLDLREIQGKDANLIGASVEYDSRHGMKYSINYKKTPFGDDLKPIESCYCSIGCSF